LQTGRTLYTISLIDSPSGAAHDVTVPRWADPCRSHRLRAHPLQPL